MEEFLGEGCFPKKRFLKFSQTKTKTYEIITISICLFNLIR